MMRGSEPVGAGLYIHWPFCESKCPYCDFNSHVADALDEDVWCRALIRELEHTAATAAPVRIETVFFGGGTPSLMSPSTVGSLINAAASLFPFGDDIEVTLEANPSSVETARFRGFHEAGVNRVSIGVQSLNNNALRFLGRRHDAVDARRAVETAHQFFRRVSLDLIYARPGQEMSAWRDELREALAITGDHISLYQLTIEKGTAFFGDQARGVFIMPDEELTAAFFEITEEETARSGHHAYEVSNHAKPGAECRHNVLCWQGADYFGIGPGAHGRIRKHGQRHATERIPGPVNWLTAVERQGHGMRRCDPVGRTDRIEELLITGLRLTAGLDRTLFRKIAGKDLEDCFDMNRLHALVREHLICLDENGLRATRTGIWRLNALTAELAVALLET